VKFRLPNVELRKVLTPWEIGFALLAAAITVPIWLVDYPPIQDLPQHLATIRVLHDYSSSQFAFATYFTTALSKTQYLTYYFAVHLLAYPFGIFLGNKLFISASLIGLPYSVRALGRRLGSDPWNALLVLPLAWSSQLILGFVNFVAAIPLMLWGIAVAVDLKEEFSWKRAGLLMGISVVCFYTHVVPFGILALGAGLVGLGRDFRVMPKRLAALLPAAVAAVIWLARAPAGAAARTAAVGTSAAGPKPVFESWDQSLTGVSTWLTDILQSEVDEKTLVAWAALVLVTVAAGEVAQVSAMRASARRRLAVVLALTMLGYFVAPSSYSWIWPIKGRFPILAAILLVPLLPPLKKSWAVGVQLLAAAAGLVDVHATSTAFVAFQKDEVGDLPAAIDSIPEGQRVAGLVFSPGSRNVKFSPFLHSVAWYQARRGGAVMFTFADFAASPVVFRENNRPPRVRPRWEWMPTAVDPVGDLSWFDYVLVRGGPGRIAQVPNVWERIHASEHWSVWRRVGGAGTSPPP
jgi:hypothetical protein